MNSFGISTDDVLIVSVDGGCEAMGDIDDGIINATSQQYPSRMASLGVEWGIRNALTGEVPSPEDSEFYTEGLDIFNTGVTLITNDPQDGVASITAEEGRAICWGSPVAAQPGIAVNGVAARPPRSSIYNRRPSGERSGMRRGTSHERA